MNSCGLTTRADGAESVVEKGREEKSGRRVVGDGSRLGEEIQLVGCPRSSPDSFTCPTMYCMAFSISQFVQLRSILW